MWFPHLILLLIIYTFGPGLLLVRPLRLAPRERLVVAIGVGLFLNYILGFVVFAFDLDLFVHTGVTALCVLLGILATRDWIALLSNKSVRRLLLCWLILFIWGMVLLSMIRNYGGGTWGGDWVEHYQRFSFFFGGAPYDYKFIGQYPLPMRPPMMNVLTASLLGQTIDEPQMYEAYQVVFVFLNSLVYLPLAILIPRLIKLPAKLARKTPWTLAALLAASPMFDQNLTYAWTKLFAAYYALAGIAIYLHTWRRPAPSPAASGEGWGESSLHAGSSKRGESSRTLDYATKPISAFRLQPSTFGFPLAFALLCIGFLVHFSVGPYGLFLGLHYLIVVWWRRPKKFAEAGLIAAASLLVFCTWFPWSIAHYGAKTTFTSTSAVSDAVKQTPSENVWNILKNAGNTLVPTIVQNPKLIWAENVAERDIDLDQPSTAGKLRDFAFLIYQVSLPGGLGIAGCVVAVVFLWRIWTRDHATVETSATVTGEPSGFSTGLVASASRINRSVQYFWIAFIPVVYVAGVAVYGGIDRFGVAHICLQPLILLGIALVAGAAWQLTLRVRMWLLIGLLVDFAIGVLLHMTLQHHVPLVVPVEVNGVQMYRAVGDARTPARAPQNNAADKLSLGSPESPRPFWGDRFEDPAALGALQFTSGAMLAFLLFMGLAKPERRRVHQLRTEPLDSPRNRKPQKRRSRK